MPKPNLFILGAAKCGTTSLHYCLNQHPDVFMSPVKEPVFFCESFQIVNNPILYFRLFEGAENAKYAGEASHAYFTSPTTPPVLKSLFPDARFILILRHPADRAYSLYHHMRRYGFEKTATFEKALLAEEKRAVSREFKARCQEYFFNYLYYRSGLYAPLLERYYNVYDRERFHILTLERFRVDPQGCLRDIFNFLEIDPDAPIDTTTQNEGGVTRRFPLLQYLYRRRIYSPLQRRKRARACRWCNRVMDAFNLTAVPPMNPETRAALSARYARSLDRLAELTGVTFPKQI